MSRQANKTLIGAFVVGAVVLLIVILLIFGSGNFLTKKERFVLYFGGSVKGLDVGSPVMFRGVRIGSVKEIQLRFDPDDLSIDIPVIIELEPYRFESATGRARTRENMRLLVDRGLRAKLEVKSILTGQLMVDFDFKPDEPAQLKGIGSDYTELPTIPSDLEKLSRTIENIPFEEIMNKLLLAIEGIEKTINSPDLIASLSGLNQTLRDTQSFLKNVDSQVEPLVSSIRDTADSARAALLQIEKTMKMEEGAPAELISGVREVLASARDAMKQAENTLSAIEGFASQDSGMALELRDTLTELSTAARSVRFLADYLERHPEALLRGKGSAKGE